MQTEIRAGAGASLTSFLIPGVPEPLSLRLPPDLAALCEEALTLHQEKGTAPFLIPELTLSDARAWTAHTEAEDWLIWRARRCADRLYTMPLDLEPGERIVGKPRFRDLEPGEKAQLEAAQRILATMPPFPGGDAGHFHPDYEMLFRLGIRGILREIDELQLSGGIPSTGSGQALSGTERLFSFYDACRIALEGLSVYIRRVADGCEQMARGDGYNDEWLRLAAICRRVATEPPATFHEAIQLMYLTLVALWFGEDHGLTCPGRMDQTLRPFYEADLAAGRLTRQEAFELICCLYIQVNRLLGTGLALAVLVGGRDGQGRDVTNELTHLCLAGRLATKLSYPTVGLAWHEGTPPELMDVCVRMLAHGRGDPAFFNDELISAGLRDHGVSVEDSYNYMNSTCVEIKVVGRSNVWVTQPYFNLAQGLLDVMEAVARGHLSEPPTFEALAERVRGNLAGKVHEAAEQLDRVWWARPERGGFPLASCFTHDCLERGVDFDRGGAAYNWVENSFVGLANLVDSLVAVRHLVYETGELTLAQFYEILAQDFRGHERLRQYILNRLPKYGNDDPAADQLAAEWADFLIATTESNQIGPHRYVPGFFCWIQHERMGSQTLATPDGRRAFWPLADGAGAGQGREKCGPTASILSTTGWSHRQALGGLVQNVKFPGNLLRSEAEQTALRELIETYLRRGGFEIQVNVVSRDTLLAAREHPEQYRDLLVRVAGYSDYFVKLEPKMQEEIIARTEYGL